MQALEQAKRGRLHILDAMYACIPEARVELKPHAPRIEQLNIDREFIGAVIGPGGKVIQEIQKTTGATITITEVNGKGLVEIFGDDDATAQAALARIKGIVAVPEVGEVYDAKVKTVMPYGAFVEFLPGKDGLLHISEVEWRRLDSLEGVLKEGDMIKVKYIGNDPKTGKFKLSRKVLLPKPEAEAESK